MLEKFAVVSAFIVGTSRDFVVWVFLVKLVGVFPLASFAEAYHFE